jgi:protein involved in temperature-dependent protein secretion
VNADTLFREGRLSEAIDALTGALRQDPTDLKSRLFLFELLCFSGAYERAGKQLGAVITADPEAAVATAWYAEALHAEEQRQSMFKTGELPDEGDSPGSVSGTLNGEPFSDLRDADPRIGPRLEVIVGGRYTWLPLEHLAHLKIEPPAKLRRVRRCFSSTTGSFRYSKFEISSSTPPTADLSGPKPHCLCPYSRSCLSPSREILLRAPSSEAATNSLPSKPRSRTRTNPPT